MSAPETISRRPTLRPIASFIAANLLFATGLIFHAFLYNYYLDALHLSTEAMGHAAAALAGGGLITLLPAGLLTDRAGPKAAVTTAAAMLGLGLACGAIVAMPLGIYAAAGLAGAGSGVWRVAVPPVLMGLTDQHTRARAFAWNVGLLVAWGGLGTALAGAAPQWLAARWGVEQLTALRAALLLGAAASAGSVILFRALRPSHTASPAGAQVPVPRDLVRTMVPVIGLVAMWMLGAALAAPFFNIYFTRSHGLSIERTGVLLAAGNVVSALAALAGGELASRFGLRRVLATALLGFAPAMAGLSLVGTLGLATTLFILQALIGPLTNPLIDQWLLGETPRDRQGAVSSWRQVAADASAMIGASIGGVLLVRGSFSLLFMSAGAVGLVGALGLIAVLQRSAARVRR